MCAAGLAVATTAELIPIAVVAKLIGQSERTLYRLISRGDFPEAEYRRGGTVGRRIRLWRRHTVLGWIDANVVGSGPT
jgi:predicted DNA-binding transcriptional regulator AlpA